MIEHNPSRPKSAHEKELPKPFSIRGHHIDIYAELIRGTNTASDAAKGFVTNLTKYYPEVTPEQYDVTMIRRNDKSSPQYKQSYRADTIGFTAEHAAAAEEAHTTIYEEFMALPDDAPVILTEAKDEICQRACFIGDHCSSVPTQVNGDRLSMSTYKAIAEKNGIGDDLATTTGTETRFNFLGKPEDVEVKSLVTTKGAIRKVFEDEKLNILLDEDPDDYDLFDQPDDAITKFRRHRYNLSESIHGPEAVDAFDKDFI